MAVIGHHHEAADLISLLMKVQDAAVQFAGVVIVPKPAFPRTGVHPSLDKPEDSLCVFSPRLFVARWRILLFPVPSHGLKLLFLGCGDRVGEMECDEVRGVLLPPVREIASVDLDRLIGVEASKAGGSVKVERHTSSMGPWPVYRRL